ncbi:DHA1 family purine base/nucleoside efflux pump-like MFS transporter [Murinocardiopsis flavida]|uniref:DHA1 family purine base/nucleoside efflux pump-like MFS transporter n=1 Tax=Murinocardiopsis flavida TaxID=645275 RepID=A0A2P8DSK7_9ACTN|nr:MFS transporter [Murinocardiopsis flavida]PSL00192.1 DHA1 family purine base/nucleoside efflux pump-like MFS transporter [Murinocardiopsis flavida]
MSVRILSLALGNFAVNTGAYLAAGMLSDIASSTGVTVSAAGQLVTVYALSYALSAPLMSGVFGHLDRRKLLWTGLALCTVGNVLTALAPGFGLLAAARAVTAIGASLFTPIAVVMAADLVPAHRRGRAVALVVTGSTLATVLGVPAGVLLAEPLGYQGAYLVVTVLSAIAAVALTALPRTARMPRMALRRSFTVLGDTVVVLVLGVSALAALSDFTPYTFVVPLLDDFGGFTAGTVSAVLIAYGVAGAVGNAVAGWATDRFGSTSASIGALSALALGLLLLPLAAGSVPLTMAAVLLWGLGGWGILPAVQARLIELAPLAASSVIALNVSVIWLGMGLGGVLGGAVIDTVGLGALGPAGGLLAIAAIAVLAVACRGRRRTAAARPAAATAEPELATV